MDKTCQHKPIGMAVSTNGLGRLQQMHDLRQLGIWVRLVDQGVQKVQSLPRRHAPLVKCQPLGFFLLHKRIGLVLVVRPIKCTHTVNAGFVVIAVSGLRTVVC